jgi:hypothetical protein
MEESRNKDCNNTIIKCFVRILNFVSRRDRRNYTKGVFKTGCWWKYLGVMVERLKTGWRKLQRTCRTYGKINAKTPLFGTPKRLGTSTQSYSIKMDYKYTGYGLDTCSQVGSLGTLFSKRQHTFDSIAAELPLPSQEGRCPRDAR